MQCVEPHYLSKISELPCNQLKSNILRSILTVMIIAVGITALVGILTAIESIKTSITKEFTVLGANTFSITSRGMRVQVGNQRYSHKKPFLYFVL